MSRPTARRTFTCACAVALAGVLLVARPAHAQESAADFPNHPIKVVVSAPPGGGVDIVARIIAEKLHQQWRQPVIIENRPGAGGNLGAETAAAAVPDGYTLLAAQPAPLTTNAFLYKKLNFDPHAFEPLAIMTSIPNLLMVRPDFPAKSLAEFLAYAKANPGKINYSSQGYGTTPHLTCALLEKAAGIKLTHVPYKGTAAMVNDLVAGHVDMTILQLQQAAELHRAGKVRALAIAALKRSPALPDVPTFDEAGVPGFVSDTWNAIVAPPKTPAAIVAKLNQAINEALKAKDTAEHLDKLSMTPVGGTPAEISRFFKSETTRWGEVIRSAGIKLN